MRTIKTIIMKATIINQNDSELENELQELYILCKHWLEDISFMEYETGFFKKVIQRFEINNTAKQKSEISVLNSKIQEQELHLSLIKAKIPEFLEFLKPYLKNTDKVMSSDFLEKYNTLEAELKELFKTIKATKMELFDYTEKIMVSQKVPENEL